MFNKLKEFLKSQTDDSTYIESQKIDKLWREMAKHINDVIIAYQSMWPHSLNSIFEKRAISIKENEELQIKIFNNLLSGEFKEDYGYPLTIIDDLKCLLIYYNFLAGSMPLSLTLRIDFIMTRLASTAVRYIVYIEEKKRYESQSIGGINTIKANADARRSIAIMKFHKMGIEDVKGKSANKLYNEIGDEIGEDITKLKYDAQKKFPFKKRPSGKSIGRYLLTDKITKNSLKKLGIIKDKPKV